MPLNEQKELIGYLREVVQSVRDLQNLISKRNKTKKFKALASLLKIVEGRADSSLQYAKNGGYSELPLSMQQQMYTPIIEWLASEASS